MKRANLIFIFCFFCALSISEATQATPNPAQPVNPNPPKPAQQTDVTKANFEYDGQTLHISDDYSLDLQSSDPPTVLVFTKDEISHLQSMWKRQNVSESPSYIYAQMYPVGANFGIFRFHIPKKDMTIRVSYYTYNDLPEAHYHLCRFINRNNDCYYDFVAYLMFLTKEDQNNSTSSFLYEIIFLLASSVNQNFIRKAMETIPSVFRSGMVKKIISIIEIVSSSVKDLNRLNIILANKSVISEYL